MAKHVYGCHPTPAHIYNAVPLRYDPVADLPPSVDLTTTGDFPPVVDQGQLGSCTANAISGAVGFDVGKQGAAQGFQASRLFIYYNERSIEGTVSNDSGATIADSVKAVNEYGAPAESDWPYDIAKFTQKPPAAAYTDGKQVEAVKYATVSQATTSIKAAIAAGYPVVIGFTVFASFESDEVATTGVVPMPASGEQELGGHAVVVVGYDDAARRYKVRNSWGTGWGQGGYFTMPYAYLADANLASDFWTVTSVTFPGPIPNPQPTPQPVPPAPPAPIPVPGPADVDLKLWQQIGAWAHGDHHGANRAAAHAVLQWALELGYLATEATK